MPFVDHSSMGVADLAAGARFYDRLMRTLGARRLYQDQQFVGYGTGPANGGFSICRVDVERNQPGAHICFAAGNREEVEEFHRVGLAGGAQDNGPPGYRLEYDPDYFGAFLVDPFGNHIGAVARLRPDAVSTPRARVIDHMSVGIANFSAVPGFYDTLFEALDVQRLYTSPDFIIFGRDLSDTTFMLLHRPEALSTQPGFHTCFAARSPEEVHAFHAAGLAAGGRDNGRPGHRPAYSHDYYGSFVIDPEGNHLGVVARVSPERFQ